ncbi:MAG: histidine--tRNA ligase [Erysipelotrichaceae bacterium]
MKNYQNPRGTVDLLPETVKKWKQLERLMNEFCTVYGYDEIRTPIFEDTSVFKRENDSSDMVNKEMYTFSINQSDFLTLRPEGTAGVIRSFVQHKAYGSQELPVKYSYLGPMFRYERPQKGRQRQFWQFGVENIGLKNPLIDVEVMVLGYSIIKALGIDDIKVLVNTLGDDASRSAYREALQTYFKPYVDGLCGDCKRRYEQNPLRILDCKVDKDQECMHNVPALKEYLNEESKAYFEQVLAGLDALDIPYEIDNNLVRGLDYYTHTVFEVVSTHPESGSQSTIFAGGRYDNLVSYFNGPELSGVGFAMGMERLLILIEALNIDLNVEKGIDCYVMRLGEVGCAPLEIVTMLRSAGYTSEFAAEAKSLKAQFKSVDRKQARFAIIVGESELAQNEVVVKDTRTREQYTVKIEQLIDQLDHLSQDEHHEH